MVLKRVNTLKLAFDKSSQRPQPSEIHDFILEKLKLTLDQLYGIQLVSVENAVYIKLVSQILFEKTLRTFEGTVPIHLYNGEVTQATISDAGQEITSIRLFNVPFEASDTDITSLLLPYGKVKSIVTERWSRHYRVTGIQNGLKAVDIELIKPIPSFLLLEKFKISVVYDGQPQTCLHCNLIGHMRHDCPTVKQRKTTPTLVGETKQVEVSPTQPRLFASVAKPTTPLRDELQESNIHVDPGQQRTEDQPTVLTNVLHPNNSKQHLLNEVFPENERTPPQTDPKDVEQETPRFEWSDDKDESAEPMELTAEHSLKHTVDTDTEQSKTAKRPKTIPTHTGQIGHIEENKSPDTNRSKDSPPLGGTKSASHTSKAVIRDPRLVPRTAK